MMLIGHSIAHSVHLMQRSSSSRNIPRNRSGRYLLLLGVRDLHFLLEEGGPVPPEPLKEMGGGRFVEPFLQRHGFLFPVIISTRRRRGVHVLRREPVATRQRLPQPRQQ